MCVNVLPRISNKALYNKKNVEIESSIVLVVSPNTPITIQQSLHAPLFRNDGIIAQRRRSDCFFL